MEDWDGVRRRRAGHLMPFDLVLTLGNDARLVWVEREGVEGQRRAMVADSRSGGSGINNALLARASLDTFINQVITERYAIL